MFFKGSRYENVGDDELTVDGRQIRFKKTRFIGDATPRVGYRVLQMDRLDLIAHRFFKDPERFWRICDANEALWPPDLVASPGDVIGIPSSQEE